jgi:hypothetical protein
MKDARHYNRCAATGKVAYPTARDAHDALKRVRQAKRKGAGERVSDLHVYCCHATRDHWHIGHAHHVDAKKVKPAKEPKLSPGAIERKQCKALEHDARRLIRYHLHEAQENYRIAQALIARYEFIR